MSFRLITIILFIIRANLSVCKNHPIYELERRLIQGDKSALLEVAKYFGDKKRITEHLGHHVMQTPLSEIAKRIVTENCAFTKEEIEISEVTSRKEFTEFINKNYDKIEFSQEATSFLITPLVVRNVRFEIRSISDERREELKARAKEILKSEWVLSTGVWYNIHKHDPKALLVIASELYRYRIRFNWYSFMEHEFIELIQHITGTEIGIENENNEISWHIDSDFDPQSKLNLLVFFSKTWSDYKWDESSSIFSNQSLAIKPISKEERLFQSLANENDTIARDAFIALTLSSPSKVIPLADEYMSANIRANYSLPTFPYRFLKQLSQLTEYCHVNAIDYLGSNKLQDVITTLRDRLTFAERRSLEDDLINTLTLEEITAFEYWALVYENSWGLTFSAGRVLDIFYSKNWPRLLQNKKHVELYLKKSALFNNLGIVGVCNFYLNKFKNSPAEVVTLLKGIQSLDQDIQAQVKETLTIVNQKPIKYKEGSHEWAGNRDHEVTNLSEQLIALLSKVQDSSKTEDELEELLSKISYGQIPIALTAIEDHSHWIGYSFMERDWGFFNVSFRDKQERQHFLELYTKLSEYELYSYYLDEAKIDYKKVNNELDYDKIYDLIKYDVVVALAGGGNSTQDNEVYSLVKLLELTFKTTLGYPRKLCNSEGIYGCNSKDRAKTWMKYMEENNLLKESHSEPDSFHSDLD